ncbi:unnamed protein product [Adineta steineri]|uniref:Disease resistance R13L4/SHOC-2-like LRR domain-containing protein n=1 Tax=Adineta steineri TaxID=433720 RepID=A0A816DCI3_9BILA|nr:unnamed protein product [Adineta steineri]CAF1635497.1 unnamed protein product [Adineta steineri]
MLLNSSGWMPELTNETENNTHLLTDDFFTSSSFEQIRSSSSTSSSSCSTESEMDGRRIYCSGRDLHTISSDIFAYPDITYLELSPTREACLNFKLNELPNTIGRLTELHILILDTNNLHKLPNELCNLRQLLILVLSNNSLSALPDNIGNMEQLESIHLANNRIRDLPVSLFQLKNLTFLDLTSNKLRQLSDGIGQLTQLQTLLLYDNRLHFIPESINQLKNLTTLWLGHNRLRTLPRGLTQLKQLDWKHNYLSTMLDENPLVNPPISICRLGFKAMDKWHEKNPSVNSLDLDGVQQKTARQSSVGDEGTNKFSVRISTQFYP